MDVIEGRKTADDLVEIAEPIDGEYIRRFQDLAGELNTCLAFGFAERIGGEVFNAAIFIDTNGEILGRYHKTQLAEGTDESWILQPCRLDDSGVRHSVRDGPGSLSATTAGTRRS